MIRATRFCGWWTACLECRGRLLVGYGRTFGEAVLSATLDPQGHGGLS